MTVFCNGFPKSGNHALWKALELLGHPAGVAHATYDEGPPKGTTHHIFIKRDPRNVIVSKLREEHDVVSPGKFISRTLRFQDASLVDEMRKFEGWLVPGTLPTLVVRFEDLIADDRVMREIGEFIGTGYIDGAFEELEGIKKDKGLTRTWNAVKSDYRDVWTEEVQKRWHIAGGDALLKRWGY